MSLLQLSAFAIWQKHGKGCVLWDDLAGQLLRELFSRGYPTATFVRRIAAQYPHPLTRRTICAIERVCVKKIGAVEIGRSIVNVRRKRFRCPFCRRMDVARYVPTHESIPEFCVCSSCVADSSVLRCDYLNHDEIFAILASYGFWRWPLRIRRLTFEDESHG
jgi:hypothetical protein